MNAPGSRRWWALGALALSLLPAGLLGDRFGRKKLLLAALVVFGAAPLAPSG